MGSSINRSFYCSRFIHQTSKTIITMKTSLLFLSFLLFSFSTNPFPTALAAHNTLDPVLDVNGDELQAGEGYYALPLLWAFGGGLTLARNINGSLCPLSVVQSPSEVENGRPLVFTPRSVSDEVIRVSTAVDIEFEPGPSHCRQSFIWTAEGGFVTTNGVKGDFQRHFTIQKIKSSPFGPTYKFTHCFLRTACQDIGRTVVNGVRPLTIAAEAYAVVFVKAGGLHIKEITRA